MGSLSLSNRAERILCVFVVPLGEDFWIAPSQTLTFFVPDDQPAVNW
jgi:hypothetical protein